MGPDIQTRRVQLRDRFASWTPCTLHERLDNCAAAYGDRPFVITGTGPRGGLNGSITVGMSAGSRSPAPITAPPWPRNWRNTS